MRSLCMLLLVLVWQQVMASEKRELIVLAAPQAGDTYYAAHRSAIFDFHVAYAAQIAHRDRVLILTDEASYAAYAQAIGADRVVVAPQGDIWMRDFSLSNIAAGVLFRYTAAGQAGGANAQQEADAVQAVLAQLMDEARLDYKDTDLLNDGGNFVDDADGRVIVSRKFLADNQLSESAGYEALRGLPGIDHVAFIDADEQGGLEHADGVVAFIAPNVAVINSYPQDPDYAAALRADLRYGLPGVEIHEIVTPYDGSLLIDPAFGSACGLYTNMLVTPQRIYFPQFGIAEDELALASLSRWTDKEVVPVRSEQVCVMGGGVRCMSWQLRGEAAQRLLRWAAR